LNFTNRRVTHSLYRKQETPLHIAVKKSNLQIIECLIAHRADPYKQSGNLGSPYELAQRMNQDVIVKLFQRCSFEVGNKKWRLLNRTNSSVGTMRSQRNHTLLTSHRQNHSMTQAPKPEPSYKIISSNNLSRDPCSSPNLQQKESVKELFDRLELQNLPSSKKKHADANLLSAVEDFLKRVSRFVHVNSAKILWAGLFYQRFQEAKNILAPQTVEKLALIFQYAVEKFDQSQSTLFIFAKSISDYLKSHQEDPDNAVIGFPCRKRLISALKIPSGILFQSYKVLGNFVISLGSSSKDSNVGVLSPRGNSNLENSNTSGVVPGLSEASECAFMDIEISKNQLLKAIETLQEAAEPIPVKLEKIQALCKFVQGLDQARSMWKLPILPGTILIIAMNKEAHPDPNEGLVHADEETDRSIEFIFVRYSHQSRDRFIHVHTTPEEKTTTEIPIFLAVPLPNEWLCYFGDSSKLERLLESPADMLFYRFMKHIRLSMQTFLGTQCQVNTELLESCVTLKAEVADYPRVLELKKQIAQLLENIPQDFIHEQEVFLESHFKKFTENLPPMFLPTQTQSIQTIFAMPVSKVVKDRLLRFSSYVDAALDHLQLQKSLVVNGTKKQEITDWWLTVITERVDEFLRNLNFDFHAVGDDYIQCAPQDLAAVRTNLKLIQEILDPKGDVHHTQDFIKSLTELIYPKIYSFLHNASMLVCEILQVPHESFSVKEFLKLLENPPSELNLPKNTLDSLEGLVRDIEYLETVIEIEKHPGINAGLNIVPISGLIMGTFVRKENELKTVLEVWDPHYRWDQKIRLTVETDQEPKAGLLSTCVEESQAPPSNPHPSEPVNENSTIESTPTANEWSSASGEDLSLTSTTRTSLTLDSPKLEVPSENSEQQEVPTGKSEEDDPDAGEEGSLSDCEPIDVDKLVESLAQLEVITNQAATVRIKCSAKNSPKTHKQNKLLRIIGKR
jgi:hypothetical protein